nr:hemagglutinin repeat-containing protein [Acinetobacter soli]
MCWIVSDFLGQKGTQLVAQNNVNIEAAQQTRTEESKNESMGWNAGVAVSYGIDGLAFGVTAGGNAGKGKGNGTETSYANSHVGSKDSQTIIQSGNTTNIIGGQVQGKGVQVDAKELNVESLQDKAIYKSKQQNIEGQVTVGIGTGVSASHNDIRQIHPVLYKILKENWDLYRHSRRYSRILANFSRETARIR